MSMVPGSAPPAPAPILVGVLYDFPQADGGASVEEAIRIGLSEVAASGRIDRPFELVARHARGLPGGTAHDVEVNYAELVDHGVLAVVGPSISDNGLIVGPMADAAGVPTINYTGGELTRSAFMFHYQVGSLQEEPVVLVEHLARQGISSLAAAYDNSPVGRLYAESLSDACAVAGIDITGSAAISPLSEDVSPTIRRLRASEPESLVYLGLGVAARAVALAVEAERWSLPVVANSSLMFGYTRRDWRAGWEGWVYVDGVSDENAARARLAEHAPEDGAWARRCRRLRHRSAPRRSRGPRRPSHPGRRAGGTRACETPAGGDGNGRDDDGIRELGPRCPEGSLSRPASMGGRPVGPGGRPVATEPFG